MLNPNEIYIQQAIELASENIKNGGGPFAAIIVKDGVIVGKGVNTVTLDNDPTAHAEVNAIRNACSNLSTFNLSACTLYASCEPCPMCLSVIYWARIDKFYYAAEAKDAASVGFDDSFIYKEIILPKSERKIKSEQILRDKALIVFKEWEDNSDKTQY